MFLTNNNKLGFIHITKTGGSSITDAFNNCNQVEWHPRQILNTHSTYNDIGIKI